MKRYPGPDGGGAWVMTGTGEDALEILDHLIAQAEEGRVAQMSYIASLLAGGQDAAKAEDDLRRIEDLLRAMREQRRIQQDASLRPR